MLNVKHFSTAFKTNILEYILVNFNLYTGIIVYACVLLAFFQPFIRCIGFCEEKEQLNVTFVQIGSIEL